MNTDWEQVRLEDITSVLGDGLHGTPTYDENGGYYFINGNNLCNGIIILDENTKRASELEYLKHKKDLNDRTILVSINGTIGNIAFYNGEKVFLGKSACYFNVIDGVDKQFVRYVLTSNLFQGYIRSYATGTTIKNVSLKSMRDFDFRLPPLSEQENISGVLASLDEKIELNRKQNRTLEAIAQALFKRWFVEFEFPDENGQPYKSSGGAMQSSELGEIPVGWVVKHLSDVVEINGWTLSTKDNLDRIEYIEISEVMRGDIKDISTYTRGEEPSRARRRLRHGDSVLSTVRPDREAYFLTLNPLSNLVASTGFAVLSGRAIPWSLLHAFVTQQSVFVELGRLADGGAYPAVRPDMIGQLPLALPDSDELLERFHSICSPLYEKAEKNRKTNNSLSLIRDTLLPKLMSGKLRILDRMSAEQKTTKFEQPGATHAQ